MEPRNWFTDEEQKLIAEFLGVDLVKVKAIGWLARLKLDTDPTARSWWDTGAGMPEAIERFEAEQKAGG